MLIYANAFHELLILTAIHFVLFLRLNYGFDVESTDSGPGCPTLHPNRLKIQLNMRLHSGTDYYYVVTVHNRNFWNPYPVHTKDKLENFSPEMNCCENHFFLAVVITCKFGQNVTTNCSENLFPAYTTVDYRCGEYYRPLLRGALPRQLRCSKNGVWMNLRRFQEYLCEIDCGKPVLPHTPFIAFGQNTLRYSWPWHATIFQQNPKTLQFHYICGGSLISEHHVLTAAHCVVKNQHISLDTYNVVLGGISSNWSDNLSEEFVQIRKIIRKFVPIEYDPREFRSDIAALELDYPVELTEAVAPVCFPFDNDLAKPEHPDVIGEGEVVGYGKNEDGEYGLNLKYVRLPVVGPRECYETLHKIPGREQFCAGVPNGGGVCQGDSGGGMVFKGQGGSRYYIQGIVSNSLQRRVSNTCNGLAYFTNVLYFTRWVSDILDDIEETDHKDELIRNTGKTPPIAAVETSSPIISEFTGTIDSNTLPESTSTTTDELFDWISLDQHLFTSSTS